MTNQRDVFLQGEGDAYEQRNPESTGLDPALLGRIARHLRPGDKALEIGCGSGANLRTLADLFGGGYSVSVAIHRRSQSRMHENAHHGINTLSQHPTSFLTMRLSTSSSSALCSTGSIGTCS